MTPDEIGLNCYRDHSALKEATESSIGSLFFIEDTKTSCGDLSGLGQVTMVWMTIVKGMVPHGDLTHGCNYAMSTGEQARGYSSRERGKCNKGH